LVYCSAWLKLHYPAAYLASLLNAQPLGFWSPQSLVADAQRHGVVVRRPCVQRSEVTASLEWDGDDTAVRLGLGGIRGLNDELATAIVRGAPWTDLETLVRTVGLRPQHTEALAMAGALDVFSSSRRETLWRAGALAYASADRLPGVVTGGTPPALPPVSDLERVSDDMWSMGLTPDATVMEYLRNELDARGVTRADALAGAEAHRVVVAGVVTHRQHPETARGAVFLNLEDETGHVNVIFSRGAWLRWESVARSAPLLLIRGTLERGQGTTAVAAEFVEELEVQVATPPSRDFR
jgi:error-prone DNA polymerase